MCDCGASQTYDFVVYSTFHWQSCDLPHFVIECWCDCGKLFRGGPGIRKGEQP